MIKSRDLIGKPLVTVTHGEIIGRVKDVLIDPERFEIAALVLPGKLFSRETMIVPRHIIVVFGKDVILVKSNEVTVRDDSLESVASLIAVSGQMKGRQMATEKGVRIGTVDDVMVDEGGRVVGYHLGRVSVPGPLAQTRQIPLDAATSVGPDLILVDSAKVEGLEEAG
jgi:uncharacterized protein YrrD